MTVDDCPWIDRDEMRRIITKAGAGDYDKGLHDPIVQSAFFAVFMAFVEGGLLTMADIEECLDDPPQQMHGGRHVFLDFARGGDENAIGVRNGNRVWLDDCWRDKNTMSGVGRFVTRLNALKKDIGLRPVEVEGDADGMGSVMVDALRDAGWPILEFHGGVPAFEPTKFKNQISERWFTGSEKIKNRQVLIVDDPECKAQMLDRQGRFEASGRRWIESKDDLFKRQSREQRPKRSPDRADALFGAMGDLPQMEARSLLAAPDAGPWANDPDMNSVHEERLGVPEEILRGFDAGN
jgi:hypothetical protein